MFCILWQNALHGVKFLGVVIGWWLPWSQALRPWSRLVDGYHGNTESVNVASMRAIGANPHECHVHRRLSE